LDLGESGLDDDSLDQLAGSSRLETLERLLLDKNRLLGDSGAESLMATRALLGLKFIDLSLCPTISAKMREQLRQHFGDSVRL